MTKNIFRNLICASIILTILLSMTQLVQATSLNFNDSDVTWIGTTTEYKKSLKSMFDSNGLRKVLYGTRQTNGELKNAKYGLVDASGRFAAQPIYASIQAEYLWVDAGFSNDYPDKETETIFVDGYTQATKNGKMGLLDKKGKEVIPCNYYSVGLPAEGVCRLIKKIDKKYYLGYWNLSLKKEIVNPSSKKYRVESYEATAKGTKMGYTSDYFNMQKVNSKRYSAKYDFYRGYALAPTGKKKTVTQVHVGNDSPSVKATLRAAQIIDKKGKAILSKGASYFRDNYNSYPQAGPYMVYQELSKKKLVMITDHDDTCIFKSHLESGVVGSKGIIIKAQYHGGILGSAMNWYPGDANMRIIPDKKLVITRKCGYNKFKESAATTGVISLSNKTVVSFSKRGVSGYNKENNLFYGSDFYKTNGKKLVTKYKTSINVSNGLMAAHVNKYANISNSKSLLGFVSLKTGKTYTHKNLQAKFSSSDQWPTNSRSNVSASSTVWVNKGTKSKPKWGLVNLSGKVILPFEYQAIHAFGTEWEKSGGYALVKKNSKWGIVNSSGKTILGINYKEISSLTKDYFKIVDTSSKIGIYNINSKKITTKVGEANGISSPSRVDRDYGIISGVTKVSKGASLEALFDLETGKTITPTYYSFRSRTGGLFENSNYDMTGPDGKIVFPRNARYALINSVQKFIGDDLTVVVKDGKVGYIYTSRLKVSGKKLPATPLPTFQPASRTPNYYLISYPEKQLYQLGEGFQTKGLIVHYQDENGIRSIVDNSKIKFYITGVEIYKGRPFTTTGIKKVETKIDDKNLSLVTFNVKVFESDTELVKNGNYYFKIKDKFIAPVKSGSISYFELSDKKPSKPFNIKLLDYSDSKGPMYSIGYNGSFVQQPSSRDGDQLRTSSIQHMWRINKYTAFCTIRDYGMQKLLVNASGAKYTNGTKVTVWSYTGSAPENGKIEFITG